MLKKLILAGIAVALVAAAIPSHAGHDSREGGYFTALVMGDSGHSCGAEDINLDELLGFCLGGYAFEGLDSGNWRLQADDDVNDIVSGAYAIDGGDITDICLDGSGTADDVGSDGRVVVWVDGVVFWALGQPCGLGVPSQGTFGTLSATHL